METDSYRMAKEAHYLDVAVEEALKGLLAAPRHTDPPAGGLLCDVSDQCRRVEDALRIALAFGAPPTYEEHRTRLLDLADRLLDLADDRATNAEPGLQEALDYLSGLLITLRTTQDGVWSALEARLRPQPPLPRVAI
jgi:hypothetical protein